jgi:hypothetical protein
MYIYNATMCFFKFSKQSSSVICKIKPWGLTGGWLYWPWCSTVPLTSLHFYCHLSEKHSWNSRNTAQFLLHEHSHFKILLMWTLKWSTYPVLGLSSKCELMHPKSSRVEYVLTETWTKDAMSPTQSVKLREVFGSVQLCCASVCIFSIAYIIIEYVSIACMFHFSAWNCWFLIVLAIYWSFGNIAPVAALRLWEVVTCFVKFHIMNSPGMCNS